MKLIKIYANKPFQTVRFNPGFNVILGEPKERKDRTKDTHNLGKSLLIDVIDFLLLKKDLKKHFFRRHRTRFIGYVLYLEIQLNSGKFLTIRRGVDNPSKISFRFDTSSSTGEEEYEQWDHENVPIDKAKEILNENLGFDVVTSWKYRKSITYFLRKQADFLDVFQLSKYNKGPHRDWKPFLFEMLGFDGAAIKEKYEIEADKKEIEKLIQQVKDRLAIGTGESDKIRGIIDVKTEEKKSVEQKVDDFNFYVRDKEINQKLVDEIDTRISTLNTTRYSVTEEIKKIRESMAVDIPTIDVDGLKQLYEEIEVFFPDNLVKGYKDLETFNYRVSEERKKYMAERLADLNRELETLEKELKKLDGMKSECLSVLKDRDSYEKFKIYQKDLAKVEAEIARLEEKLEHLDKVGELEKQVASLDEQIKEKVEAIRALIVQGNELYTRIRREFNHIVQPVLNVLGILSIFLNKKGNIEFEGITQDQENLEKTAESYGNTYKKLLCMAFDLAVLSTYSGQSFYRFVYHDGALEGLDDRKKMNFLSAVRDICKEKGLQYIMTIIDSDVPHDDVGQPVTFPEGEIVLRLHDRDDSGRLFEMKF
jgi:uncharacterized protein YydD (DUF2326 family)